MKDSEDNNEQSRKDRKKMRDVLSSNKANEEFLVEAIKDTAKMFAERVLALIENGFSRMEALDIVKYRGLL